MKRSTERLETNAGGVDSSDFAQSDPGQAGGPEPQPASCKGQEGLSAFRVIREDASEQEAGRFGSKRTNISGQMPKFRV